MARLKSRNEFPPGGFLYTESAVPQWRPPSGGSFDMVVRALIDLRRGNPALASQYNLPTDYEAVANQVDEQNAARCLAHGWMAFVADSPGPPTISFPRPQSLLGRAAAVGNAIKRPMVGVGAVKDWLGAGLQAVDKEVSSRRAAICAECPQNDPDLKGWLEKAEARIAEEVLSLLVVKDDLKAETPYDDKLGMCRVCDCVLKLKVHTPFDIVLKKTSGATMEAHRAVRTQSGQSCWVTTET